MNQPAQPSTPSLLAVVCLAAFALRAGVAWVERADFQRDPDAYLGIAAGLTRGEGYHMPGRTQPSAYRPPLYPLVLSLAIRSGAPTVAIALIHIAAGVLTVALTYRIGRTLGLGRLADGAALAVAVDPLLLQYTTQVMTETVFTFLVTLMLFLILRTGTHNAWASPILNETRENEATRHVASSARFLLGVGFGLCALCRPTVWAFGMLAAVWWIYRAVRVRRRLRTCWADAWPVVLAVTVTVAPWPLRNAVVLGKPLATTTHGGYTLLLGNNPVFYREVVAKPFGTVWEGASLARWQQSLNDQMAREMPPVIAEISRDRWMRDRAIETIRREPAMFLRACVLRLVWFWNIVPQGPARGSLPRIVIWSVGAFYGVLLILALVGALKIRGVERRVWGYPFLLLLSLTLLHTVYWSNARMRAPIVPVIALLAARGLSPSQRQLADRRQL